MIMQTLIGVEGMNKENIVKTLVPIISQGVVTRQQADSFIQEQNVDPMQILQAQQALEQAQAQQEATPITPEMVQGMSPQDMEQIYNAAAATQEPGYQDQFAMGQEGPQVDMGYDNYSQGIEANMTQSPVEPLGDIAL
jgi:hypothetical protein